MNIKITKSFNIQIWCGLKEGYNGKTHKIQEVKKLLQQFVDKESFCVSVTKTDFIYKNGIESGVMIGIISYPRFKRTEANLLSLANKIATQMILKFKQNRVTITTPKQSIMLEIDKTNEN